LFKQTSNSADTTNFHNNKTAAPSEVSYAHNDKDVSTCKSQKKTNHMTTMTKHNVKGS